MLNYHYFKKKAIAHFGFCKKTATQQDHNSKRKCSYDTKISQ